MTVPVQIPVTSSVANGVTTVFPFTFKITNEADLTVTVDDVVVTTGFTVTGVGNDDGGDVTFDTAPANGLKVIRFLNPVLSRVVDYQQFGDWLADIVNGDFDRIWLTLQSLYQALSRSIKLPVDVVAGQDITEDAADRANKVITFDVFGNVALKAGTELIPEVDEAVTNTLAAAAAAEASSSAASGFADDAEAAALAASITPVAAPTHAADSKFTPSDGDEIPLADITDSFTLKKLTWVNLKQALKAYFDTLYSLIAVNATNDPTFSSTSATDAASPEWVDGKVKIKTSTAVNTTSGTGFEFSIPAGVKRFKLTLSGVTVSGSGNINFQLGTSSSVETTGYSSGSTFLTAGTVTLTSSTTGFVARGDSADSISPIVVFENIKGTNTWVCNITSCSTGGRSSITSGTKTLSGQLTRVLMSSTSAATFATGQAQASWEY